MLNHRSPQINSATGVWLRPWGEASDNGQVVRYELRNSKDGGEWIDSENQYHQQRRISDLSPGQTYAFELSAVDAAGNRSVPQLLTVITPDGGVPSWLRMQI